MDWIKVTPETMPPEGQKVIATTVWRGKKQVEFELYRKDGEWWQDYENWDGGGSCCYLGGDVTHWMPYPGPAED